MNIRLDSLAGSRGQFFRFFQSGIQYKNMVVRIFLFFCFIGIILPYAEAQILQPAKWSSSLSSDSLTVGKEIDVFFDVSIDKGWYLYSSEFDCDFGPLKTTIDFEPHPGYQLVGKLIPLGPVKKYDDVFECDVMVFKKYARFRQRVKILAEQVAINGVYNYQVCTSIGGKCIPGEGEFAMGNISSVSDSIITYDASTNDVSSILNKGPNLDKSILGEGNVLESKSFISYLVFAFLLGLASLITPCVFPMIPMTVTFFLKEGKSKQAGIRDAIIFGSSIILIYTLAGTAFAYTLGAEGLNALATHWAPNLFIFVLFVFFALSFLGLFEINAPSGLVNKADRQAEKGGILGIFFMAATLTLVSFSCTIPIVGNVIVLAAGGDVLKPILAMFFYALAFAIPFTLFAAFPEWLKSMPRSGAWLNSVKVTLGFLELALSLKFFSIADQAYHWGILDRDINLVIWIVVFTFLGFYFLGKIRLPHDDIIEKVTVPRLFLAVVTFSFVVYLTPGLYGAPLKALAGYLPPKYTLDFDLMDTSSPFSERENSCGTPKYADFLHLPHGLSGYFDYDQALACARKKNKPLFIDFTGHGCTNCREMEAVVWSDPRVLKRLQENYVIAALYVDDKTLLPKSEWIVSDYDGKVKKTIGKKNANIQISNLENNAQPFYVLVGQDERVLAWPYGYDRDPEKFIQFLDAGKQKYAELYPQ